MIPQITIPPHLEQLIARHAAEVGVDLQTYVVNTLTERASDSLIPPVMPSDFIAKLDRITHDKSPNSAKHKTASAQQLSNIKNGNLE